MINCFTLSLPPVVIFGTSVCTGVAERCPQFYNLYSAVCNNFLMDQRPEPGIVKFEGKGQLWHGLWAWVVFAHDICWVLGKRDGLNCAIIIID